VTAWVSAAKQLAEEFDDHSWRERLSLSEAANLLGLIPARLARGRTSEPVVDYCEGLLILEELLLSLE